MPGISNLELTLRRKSHASMNYRVARVSFTTNFTQTEIFAHAVFKAVVELRTSKENVPDFDDTFRVLHVDIITLMADSNPVQSLVERHFSESLFCSEITMPENNGMGNGQPDEEWVAVVKLSPHIFETVTAESPEARRAWGHA